MCFICLICVHFPRRRVAEVCAVGIQQCVRHEGRQFAEHHGADAGDHQLGTCCIIDTTFTNSFNTYNFINHTHTQCTLLIEGALVSDSPTENHGSFDLVDFPTKFSTNARILLTSKANIHIAPQVLHYSPLRLYNLSKNRAEPQQDSMVCYS